MKTILYMAITANGYIARDNGDVNWVTEAEWANFSEMIKKNGNMIIGRKTYEVMLKNDEFNRSGLNKIKTVVLTNNTSLKIHNQEFVSLARSPSEAINTLEKQGFETIMICGGGKLNSSFMKKNLIDEIYLDVEPIVLGQGIKLFTDEDFERKLKLIETKNLSENEIQLHYKILK